MVDVDEGLVTAAMAGDRVAVDTLIGQVRPHVVRYANNRLGLGANAAAEDVTQEACLAVVKGLPRYRHTEVPFMVWVRRITANKVADAQRRSMRGPTRATLHESLVDVKADPAQTFEDRADLDVVLARIRLLPPAMARVVLLRADGLTPAEVSKVTGQTANAVRVLHHKALKRLRGV